MQKLGRDTQVCLEDLCNETVVPNGGVILEAGAEDLHRSPN